MAMKAVQISTAPVGDEHALVVALREDGMLWAIAVHHSGGATSGPWFRLPSLPQDNGDPDKWNG